MYAVDISPAANTVLEEYTYRCVRDNGADCARRPLDFFQSSILLFQFLHHVQYPRMLSQYSYKKSADYP